MERSWCAQTARVSFAGLSKNNSFISHKIGVKQPNCEEQSLAPRAAAVYCVYSVSLTGSVELRSRGSSSPLLLLGSLSRSGPPLIHGDSLLSSVSGTSSCFLPPLHVKPSHCQLTSAFTPPPSVPSPHVAQREKLHDDECSDGFFSFLFFLLSLSFANECLGIWLINSLLSLLEWSLAALCLLHNLYYSNGSYC